MSLNTLQTYAGIHLSGPNAHKTSVVIMTGGLREGNLKITHVFDKIGAIGQIFSDERLLDILKATLPRLGFVDAPLSEPPCVACTRPTCPGIDGCEDLGVANMQSIISKSAKGKKRKRPINPQTQRYWDVRQWAESQTHLQEPSYSANMAPLVVRAKTLQRRINSWNVDFKLKETLVSQNLRIIADHLSMPSEWAQSYRAFGVGRDNRGKILEHLYREKWLALNHLDDIASSVENFHAMICALTACLFVEKRVLMPGSSFELEQGWVYLPNLTESKKD